MDDFRKLGISNWLCKALKSLGIEQPSNIQRSTIPLILSAERPNVFACSRTGSGKTLAFILPIIERLVRDPKPYYALILSPTRELSQQIYEMIKALTATTFALKTLLIIGGQIEALDESRNIWFSKPNIVVATPGRLLDHLLNRNFLDICGHRSMIRFDMLVLDEADQLISSGFCQQMKEILRFFDEIEESSNSNGSNIPKHRRQTLLFSATLTQSLEKLREILIKKNESNDTQTIIINQLPTTDEMKLELKTNTKLDQRFILCPEAIKIVYLVECILDLKFKQLIVFCRTKKEANLIHKVLLSLGFDGPDFRMNPMLLNSNLKQSQRFESLEQFRSLKSKILVTTDIANRGLDLPQVDLVINFNCPKSPINYIHRVGRTCRKPDFRYEMPAARVADDSDDSEADSDGEDSADQKGRSKRKNHQRKPNALKPTKKRSKISIDTSMYLGKSITIITQYDLELFKAIEAYLDIRMNEEKLDEKNVQKIIKQVAVAIKEAEIQIEQEQQESKQLPRIKDSRKQSTKKLKPRDNK